METLIALMRTDNVSSSDDENSKVGAPLEPIVLSSAEEDLSTNIKREPMEEGDDKSEKPTVVVDINR